MSAYLVIEANPSDLKKFGEYERGKVPGTRTRSRSTATSSPALGVILRFPDKQAVRDFFDSAEYTPVRTLRQSFAAGSYRRHPASRRRRVT